jgi:hypothetical protein
MRFHYGAIPEADDFEPEDEGWLGIREPNPLILNFLAVPAAILMAGLTIGLLSLVYEGGPLVIWRSDDGDSSTTQGLLILAVIFGSIPVHELVHALTHPRFGLSSESILGFQLSRGLFYAQYEGEMSRNRFLAILAMPFLILSLLPVAIMAFIGSLAPMSMPSNLGLAALINSIYASADAVGVALLLSQIPSAAVVRNKGWKSFWKYRASGVS